MTLHRSVVQHDTDHPGDQSILITCVYDSNVILQRRAGATFDTLGSPPVEPDNRDISQRYGSFGRLEYIRIPLYTKEAKV